VLLRLFAFKPAADKAEKKTLKSAEVSPVAVMADMAKAPSSAPTPPARVAASAVAAAALPTAPSDNTLSEAWFLVVEQLVTGQKIQAMTRELAMQSQLMKQEASRWVLQVERESLVSSANVERLQTALHEAGHTVTLVTQIGAVVDSPAVRLAHRQQARLSAVEEEILNDPVVQQLIAEFDAKIVPGSIKTTTY
jgi:DNA polymerase-3 subunit gamma/tau